MRLARRVFIVLIDSVDVTYRLVLADSCQMREAVEVQAQDSGLADLEYEAEVPGAVQALAVVVRDPVRHVLRHRPLCHRTDCLGHDRFVGEVAIGWHGEELLGERTGLVRRVGQVHVVVLQCPLRIFEVVSQHLAARQ